MNATASTLIRFSKAYHGKTAKECLDAYCLKYNVPLLRADHDFFCLADNGFINLYLKDHAIVIGK